MIAGCRAAKSKLRAKMSITLSILFLRGDERGGKREVGEGERERERGGKREGERMLKNCFSVFSLPEGDLDFEEIIFKMNWTRNPAYPVPPQLVPVNLD